MERGQDGEAGHVWGFQSTLTAVALVSNAPHVHHGRFLPPSKLRRARCRDFGLWRPAPRLAPPHSSAPTLSSGAHCPVLCTPVCFSLFIYLGVLLRSRGKRDHIRLLFSPVTFHCEQCPQGPSLLSQDFSFFSWLSSVPL